VNKLEKAFPKLLDKDFLLQVEHYSRVREEMTKAFTRDELRSMIQDDCKPIKH
jgi:hypothetical protein